MKKFIAALALIAMFSTLALADIGVGFEALTIMPHALTLYLRDTETGWGAKLSADFGASTLSSGGDLVIKGFGTLDIANLYTLMATKDVYYDGILRNYIKFGGTLLQGDWNNEYRSIFIPSVGYGWEWHKGLFGQLASSVELGFPEICTLGFRHYFE